MRKLTELITRDPDTLSSSDMSYMDRHLPLTVTTLAVAVCLVVNVLLAMMGVKA